MSVTTDSLVLQVRGTIDRAARFAQTRWSQVLGVADGDFALYRYRQLVTSFNGKFVFNAWLAHDRTWLFGLLGSKSTKKLADVRVIYHCEASFEPASDAVTPPRFLVRRASGVHLNRDGKKLTAVLGGGRVLQVDSSRRYYRGSASSFEGATFEGTRLELGLDRISLHPVLDFIDQLLLRGSSADQTEDVPLEQHSALGRLITPMMETLLRPGDDARSLPSNVYYRTTSTEVRLLLQVDENGRPGRPADDLQWGQIDLVCQAREERGIPTVRVELRIPDIVLPGDDYQPRFAVSAANAITRAHTMFSDAPGILAPFAKDREAWQRFVEGSRDEMRFVRLTGTDIDLVLMGGTFEGARVELAWIVKFEVTEYPEVAVKDAKAKSLLGVRRHADDWSGLVRLGSEQDHLGAYFLRMVKLFASLERGFGEAPA